MYLLISPAGIQEEIRISLVINVCLQPPLSTPPYSVRRFSDFETEGASNAKKICGYAKKKPTPPPFSNGSHARVTMVASVIFFFFKRYSPLRSSSLLILLVYYSYLMILWWRFQVAVTFFYISFLSICYLYYLMVLWKIRGTTISSIAQWNWYYKITIYSKIIDIANLID